MGVGAIDRDACAEHAPQVEPLEATAVSSSEHSATVEEALEFDVIPASPPSEVLDAIDAAAEAYQELAADGQHVSFDIDPRTGRMQIQLEDESGRPISGLTPSAALRLASGGRLD